VDWREAGKARLPEHLDSNGDLAPPWVEFPEYERHTLGWRMGGGESWMIMWGIFLEKLGTDPAVRLAYLQRHAPAPFTWADTVHAVLNPSGDDEDENEEDDVTRGSRAQDLERRGLIASDIAYSTWCRRYPDYVPWRHAKTPFDAARHGTRDFWFWSRRVQELRERGEWRAPELPAAWEACAAALREGAAGAVDVDQGLRTLAKMLCAGRVVPPWELELEPEQFADSFDDDMGYVDAYRLWGMSAFDDEPQRERFVPAQSVPAAWRAWMVEHFTIG
jgi:hypothetical protein